jgi:hypothetical protein
MPDPEALRIARGVAAQFAGAPVRAVPDHGEEPPPHDAIPPEADAEPDYEPAGKPGASQGKPAGAEHQPIRFKLIAFENVTINRNLRRYLVKKLLPNSGLTVVWGPPKCGKSFWIMDLALHVALGWEYRGRRVQQATVVYVALEGQAGMPDRVEAFRAHHGITGAVPFHLLLTRLNLILDAPKLIADIKAQLGDVNPGLIVLDTLNRSLVGSESKDEDMSKYLGAADLVAEQLGGAVALVHHCGIDASRPRGHTSLTGSVECQISAKRNEAGHVETEVEYAKDFEDGGKTTSELEVVAVGTDPDGDEMTSLVVRECEASRSAGQSKGNINAQAARALEALQNVIGSDQAITMLPGNRRAANRSTWIDELARLGMVDPGGKPDSARNLINRWRRELIAARRIACEGDLTWLL